MLEVMILISGGFLWHRLRQNLYRRLFDPPGKSLYAKGAVKKSILISSQPLFALLSFGSGFRVQGSGGGFAAFF